MTLISFNVVSDLLNIHGVLSVLQSLLMVNFTQRQKLLDVSIVMFYLSILAVVVVVFRQFVCR